MSSKSDLVVKLSLVFFISLLSFSIGTFVGKKYSDNQHQLALLEPTKNSNGESKREVASVGEEKTGVENATKGNAAMSDEEIAKLAEEFVADETESPEKGEATEAKTAEAKVSTEKGEKSEKTEKKEIAKEEVKGEPSRAAQALAAGEKTETTKAVETKAAPTKTERVPSSLPKNVAAYTVGKFTVQVAAYADEGEAQKMASGLKQKGYSAFYIPATVKGKTWYRVSVGQFATIKEAQSYKGELMDKAKVGTAIVQKITE